MNRKSKKSTQIFLGILTSIGLWIIGHLLSGRFAFVEDIELYPAGPLVIIFPFVFAAACILVVKYSVSAGKYTYYKTSMIVFTLPAVCFLICNLFSYIVELRIPVVSSIADFFVVIFMIPTIAMFSIYYQLLDLIGTGTDGIKLILVKTAYFFPMLAGMLISFKIYKDSSKD